MENCTILNDLLVRYPQLSVCKENIIRAFDLLSDSYRSNGKLLVCGNGGSAADAEHIVGELMKGFKNPRRLNGQYQKRLKDVDDVLGNRLAGQLQGALPAIALDGHSALTTAYMNDCDPLLCFAQQVNGYGQEGDILLGISTSGNSKNVIYAAVTAKAKGMKVIGLTGSRESRLFELADVCIRVPEMKLIKYRSYIYLYITVCA